MAVINLPANVSPFAFAAELLEAIPDLRPAALLEDGEIFHKVQTAAQSVTVPAEHEAAARAILAQHDNERTLRDRADAALDALEGAWASWPTLTAAQKDAALKLTVRVVVTLARLVLRRLDSA